MLKGIPIGIEDFKKIRETDCYYIDCLVYNRIPRSCSIKFQ